MYNMYSQWPAVHFKSSWIYFLCQFLCSLFIILYYAIHVTHRRRHYSIFKLSYKLYPSNPIGRTIEYRYHSESKLSNASANPFSIDHLVAKHEAASRRGFNPTDTICGDGPLRAADDTPPASWHTIRRCLKVEVRGAVHPYWSCCYR